MKRVELETFKSQIEAAKLFADIVRKIKPKLNPDNDFPIFENAGVAIDHLEEGFELTTEERELLIGLIIARGISTLSEENIDNELEMAAELALEEKTGGMFLTDLVMLSWCQNEIDRKRNFEDLVCGTDLSEGKITEIESKLLARVFGYSSSDRISKDE
jgi:hypothetical protein